jgi:maleate cis-trans isomerase
MGWKEICLAGPYTQQIMDRFIGVLKARGYKILNSKTLDLKYLDELKNTPVQKAYDIAMGSFTPGTDGIFIPCTTFRSIDVIEKIEKETGVPVITSNQASLWECLRIIGNDELVEGYGKLLRIPNRSQFKGLPR